MLLLAIAAVVTSAAAAPATYDQRQEGDFNVRADVQNVVLLVAIPQKLPFSMNLLDGLLKDGSHANHDIQERSDMRVMEAFVEPPTPYRVDIGEEARWPEGEAGESGEGRAVEVLIAGRRRADPEPTEEDLKLLGAQEQCGPGRQRDPDTLMCRDTPAAVALDQSIIAPLSPPPKSDQESKTEKEIKPQEIPSST